MGENFEVISKLFLGLVIILSFFRDFFSMNSAYRCIRRDFGIEMEWHHNRTSKTITAWTPLICLMWFIIPATLIIFVVNVFEKILNHKK